MAVTDFGALGDATYPSGGTDDTAAFQAALAALNGRTLYVPFGLRTGKYRISRPLVLPDNVGLIVEQGVEFLYTDSAARGSYMLTNGVADNRGGGVYAENLSIALCTPTAKGIDLFNSVKSVFNNTYVQGFIPKDWQTNRAAVNARTNVGLRIRSSRSTDSFWNVFNTLWVNHCRTGVLCPPEGIATQQIFNQVFLFGDSVYGDTGANGFSISGCQDSIVNGGFCEAYAAGSSAGFNLVGPRAVRWKVRDVTFDHANAAGAAVPMNAIRIANDAGHPEDNSFTGCSFTSSTAVQDASPASAGNFVENNPTTPGAMWTATLVAATSGQIKLTSGPGGDRCYCVKRGKEVRVWGTLTVASVVAPRGRLQIPNLPFRVMNDNSNYAPVHIRAEGLEATTSAPLQGYANRGSTIIEIERFAAGTMTPDTAAQLKAGSILMFSCDYIAA
jgi:hypothetical protein